MDTVTGLAVELERAYKERLLHPFPYADVRKLAQGQELQFEGLIPDLDMHFYGIASPCGAARKLLKLPRETLLEVRQRLERSFFERHPEYEVLRERITAANTRYLYQEMIDHEEVRAKLLELLSELLTEKTI